MKGSNATEERAAQWLWLRESGHWSDAEQARLEEWFAQATANRIAYLRLEAGWEQTNRLKALGAGFSRGKVPSAEALEEKQQSGRPPFADAPRISAGASHNARSPRLAIAAAVLVTFAAGIALYSANLWKQERYATIVGAVTSVPLKDGTNVILNTASKMRVELTDTVRKVELSHGEAFFDVAKDAARPFVVQAGDRTITVLGTKFSVRYDASDVRVIVTEGKVAVSSPGASAVDIVVLNAGDSVRAVDRHVDVQKLPVTTAEEILSWRTGYLVLKETSLTDAVAEFNRYNTRRIVIADPAVGAIRLTGKFRATNCQIFVRLLQDSFQIQAHMDKDQIVLTRR